MKDQPNPVMPDALNTQKNDNGTNSIKDGSPHISIAESFQQIRELKENQNAKDNPVFDPKFVNQIEIISKRMILPPEIYPAAKGSIQFVYNHKNNLSGCSDDNDEQYHKYYLVFTFASDNKVYILYSIEYCDDACEDALENMLYSTTPYQEFSKCLDFNDMTLKYMNALVNYLMHDKKEDQIKMLDSVENAILFALNNSFENKGFNDVNNIQRITTLKYDSLTKDFYKLIDHVLGKDYYIMGMDSYTCNAESCSDLKYRFDTLKSHLVLWRGIAIITTIAFLAACAIFACI